MIDARTVQQTLSMFDDQNLDIRTVTLGISLQSCVGSVRRPDGKELADRRKIAENERSQVHRDEQIASRHAELLQLVDDFALATYHHITGVAADLKRVVDDIADKYGIKIANRRLSVTPIGNLVSQFFGDDELFGEIDSYDAFKDHPSRSLIEEIFFTIAFALDEARRKCNVDILGGFSALVPKGMTRGERLLLYSIPTVLSKTEAICSSINVATSRAGINMDAIATMGQIIYDLAQATNKQNSFGCCKLVVYANMPEDNPYMAGAIHGQGEADAVINVGVSGPGVILGALNNFTTTTDKNRKKYSLGDLADVIKHAAYKVTKVGELVGIEAARELSALIAARRNPALAAEIRNETERGAIEFGIVDVSLAPTYRDGDSVAQILTKLGVTRVGMPGTTAALAMLTDAVKKGGVFASKFVGGMSGAFIPVSEDRHMDKAFSDGSLTLDKLEAMTSVCSVGLDMIAIKADSASEGKIHHSIWSGIIADEIAIGVFTGKTTAVRIIPVLDPRYKWDPSLAEIDRSHSKVVFGAKPEKEFTKNGIKYASFTQKTLDENLWGEAVPMPLNKNYLWGEIDTSSDESKADAPTNREPPTCSRSDFAIRGGRIPAPIHSLKN